MPAKNNLTGPPVIIVAIGVSNHAGIEFQLPMFSGRSRVPAEIADRAIVKITVKIIFAIIRMK